MKFSYRNRKDKKRNIKMDTYLRNSYKMWDTVEGLSRSFFVWKGNYSGSPKEREIYKILMAQNLKFYCEVSFDCKKRFDFYIPLIDLVIEYDGEQHFQSASALSKDIFKEAILDRLGIKLIRYNKSHDLKTRIPDDLINHPVLKG